MGNQLASDIEFNILRTRAFYVTDSFDKMEPYLIPGGTTFNHRNSAKMLFGEDAGNFILETQDRYHQGDEVFCNYSPRGNAELLRTYGFMEVNNSLSKIQVQVKWKENDFLIPLKNLASRKMNLQA